MIRFGYQTVNANLFMSAVDVYQLTFSVFGVYYRTFYTQRMAFLRSLTPIYFIKKLLDANKYVTAPQADKYVHHILVKFQFTIFCHTHTRGIFTKQVL